jgi:hypothetical protein
LGDLKSVLTKSGERYCQKWAASARIQFGGETGFAGEDEKVCSFGAGGWGRVSLRIADGVGTGSQRIGGEPICFEPSEEDQGATASGSNSRKAFADTCFYHPD